MTLKEVMKIAETRLAYWVSQKVTGQAVIKINLSQGGIGESDFEFHTKERLRDGGKSQGKF